MPDRMPDRMPENMSDRMPEDLPVTKCINVMVGITRSKVIMTFGNRGTGPILLECGKIAFKRTIGSLQRRSFGAAKLFHVGSWSGCWQHRGSSHHNSFLLES